MLPPWLKVPRLILKCLGRRGRLFHQGCIFLGTTIRLHDGLIYLINASALFTTCGADFGKNAMNFAHTFYDLLDCLTCFAYQTRAVTNPTYLVLD